MPPEKISWLFSSNSKKKNWVSTDVFMVVSLEWGIFGARSAWRNCPYGFCCAVALLCRPRSGWFLISSLFLRDRWHLCGLKWCILNLAYFWNGVFVKMTYFWNRVFCKWRIFWKGHFFRSTRSVRRTLFWGFAVLASPSLPAAEQLVFKRNFVDFLKLRTWCWFS